MRIEDRLLLECGSCGLIFFDDFLDKNGSVRDYSRYYQGESGTRFNAWAESLVRLFRYLRALGIKRKIGGQKNFLDIGSGRGYTLYYLKKYFGFRRTAGTQISKPACLFSREKLGLEIYDRDLLDLNFTPGSFDGASMIHVLEHVRGPFLYIKKIHELIRPGGIFFLEIPNFNSWTRRFTKKYWLSLDPANHLTFFRPGSIRAYLVEAGFSVSAISTFSIEYSTFSSVQSIVSRLTSSDQLFFIWLQENRFKKSVILHIFLFILLAPFCFAINLILSRTQYGEVVRIIGKKK